MPPDIFKNKIRFRVNGILQKDEAILLVQLKSPITNQLIWMPPGGGLHFGESMKKALRREFLEETGLKIEVGEFAFVNEVIEPPYHAVELYLTVKKTGGEMQLGADPELPKKEQLLKDLRWIPVDKLNEFPVVPQKLITFIQ